MEEQKAAFRATVERTALDKTLGRLHRIVEKRKTIPILNHVLIEGIEAGLMISATDLDLFASERIAAEVPAPGSLTVAVDTLFEWARKLPEGAQITFEVEDEGMLIVRSGRSRITLPTLPASDFPTWDAGDMTHMFSLAAVDLARLLGAGFAASTEMTRYYLNGVFLHVTDGQLRGVATDGHRLALHQMDCPGGAEEISGAILSTKTVREITRLLDGAERVRVELSATKARFVVGSTILFAKLIDGTFPDYARIIPTKNDKEALAPRDGFIASVERVATVCGSNGRSAVKLALGGNIGAMVSARDIESGSAEEEIDAVRYEADGIEIGMNPRYLTDIAGRVSGDEIRLRMDDPGAPILIDSPGDKSALYILMPLRF